MCMLVYVLCWRLETCEGEGLGWVLLSQTNKNPKTVTTSCSVFFTTFSGLESPVLIHVSGIFWMASRSQPLGLLPCPNPTPSINPISVHLYLLGPMSLKFTHSQFLGQHLLPKGSEQNTWSCSTKAWKGIWNLSTLESQWRYFIIWHALILSSVLDNTRYNIVLLPVSTNLFHPKAISNQAVLMGFHTHSPKGTSPSSHLAVSLLPSTDLPAVLNATLPQVDTKWPGT